MGMYGYMYGWKINTNPYYLNILYVREMQDHIINTNRKPPKLKHVLLHSISPSTCSTSIKYLISKGVHIISLIIRQIKK